ncbi:MAG: rod shape-determining protein MreD [Candidatus Edwardsbacteria bacterium]
MYLCEILWQRGRHREEQMTIRFLKIGLLFWLATVLQTTLVNLIEIKGIKPDLSLILVLYFALFEGSVYGVVLGFLGGFLQDIFAPSYLGLNIISKVVVSFLCASLRSKVYREKKKTQGILLLLLTLMHDFLYFLLLFRGDFNKILSSLGYFSLGGGIYNAVIGILVFPLLKRWFAKDFWIQR